MSYEVTGKLITKYDIVQRTETFKVREFVIEKSDDIGGRIINNYIKFQCLQDKTALPDKFNLGDEVKVFFNLKGTKWSKDGRESYFTNLDAWRMEPAGSLTQNAAIDNAPDNFVPDAEPKDVVDDLPF